MNAPHIERAPILPRQGVTQATLVGRPERIAPLTAAFLDAAGDSELTTRTSG